MRGPQGREGPARPCPPRTASRWPRTPGWSPSGRRWYWETAGDRPPLRDHRSARGVDPGRNPAHPRLRGVPAHGHPVAAPAAVPDLRARRVLRLVPDAARPRARRCDRPSDRPLAGARRELAVVLRGRGVRMTQESVGVNADVEELLATAPPGETPDLSGAYPRLSEERIRMLSGYGSRRL